MYINMIIRSSMPYLKQCSKYEMKLVLEIFMQNSGERIFSNQQLGMRVYVRIVMINF